MPHIGEKADFISPRLNALDVAPSASPFTFTADRSGIAIVRGGVISMIEFGRNGSFYTDGSTAGSYNLSAGDQLRVTYSTSPDFTFVSQ